MSNGLQIHKCTHRRWAHIWTGTCQEQRFPLFAEPRNHGHFIRLEYQCQRLSHERFSCVTRALAASTPPCLLAGNVTAILLVLTEDSFNWTPFIMYLSTVTAKACAFQKAHTSRGLLLLLIMLMVTTISEAANRGEMCGHSRSCQWECSPSCPQQQHYSLFQEV